MTTIALALIEAFSSASFSSLYVGTIALDIVMVSAWHDMWGEQ